MEKIKKNGHRGGITVFLLSFAGFLIVFAVVSTLVKALCLYRSNGIWAWQAYCHHILGMHRSGTVAAPEMDLVRLDANEYYLKDFETYYYPENWDKPGRVLLRHKWRNFYFVTFGDGSRVAVTHFSSSDPNGEPVYFRTLGEKYNYGYSWVVALGAVTIAATLWLARRQGKTRVETEKADFEDSG
ncbi:MAG: hypothetical protein ACYST6_17150 [Planctomycetota bacterium]|jgi:hypothetical protein